MSLVNDRLPSAQHYTVGWIAALSLELTAAVAVLDHEHKKPKGFRAQPGDTNVYRWGRIGETNVIIACLPSGRYGTTSAATTVMNMRNSLPHLRFCLLVGIGAGLPRLQEDMDIRLGDVVVSVPCGTSPGVIQYDLGKRRPNNTFERVGSLNNPPELLLRGIADLQTRDRLQGSPLAGIIQKALERYPRLKEPGTDGTASYTYQGSENDRRFQSGSAHVTVAPLPEPSSDKERSCWACDETCVISRKTRGSTDPYVHFGTIASGNTLVKDAFARDEIVKRLDGNCKCLEMEAAGVMNIDKLPCLVVRGICDYADAHKNDLWQPYAAISAAAYANDLLSVLDGDEIEETITLADIMEEVRQDLRNVQDQGAVTNASTRRVEFQQLWNALPRAEGAAYDSHDDEHLSECLGDTRKEILSRIETWAAHPTSKSILWMYGEAGTGKSTISRTLANRWKCDSRLAATFFFRRDERARSTSKRLMTTIAAQIAERFETARQVILDALQSEPSLPEKALSKQFESLVIRPLEAVAEQHGRGVAFVILLDALDECEDDNDISLILDVLSIKSPSVDIRIFVTSRPEITILVGFEGIQHRQDIDLFQATERTIQRDIKIYLAHMLTKIRSRSASHVCQIPDDWPDPKLLETLTGMATPLFIFAATMCRFIAQYGEDPVKRVQNFIDTSTTTSLDRLDQTYLPVLSQYLAVENFTDRYKRIKAFKCIMGTVIMLFEPLSIGGLTQLVMEDVSDDGLHRNILGARSPGMYHSEIPKERISAFISPALSYACVYWIDHLHASRPSITDGHNTLEFLKTHLLHWLEALSWLGRLPESIIKIGMLIELTSSRAPRLTALLHDAKRFIMHNRRLIERLPLQIYAAALVFAPSNSIVRKTFDKDFPEWIKLLPDVPSDWTQELMRLEHNNLVSASPDGPLPDGLCTVPKRQILAGR
ncbi:hypothetical protein CAC42_6970 [Sphaceloma murrayae]|uniref:NACHT domain-containing protein n=1 Tax=Sphaceloma murrayae TaxID=2082308 RepID=A0A2K1QQB4_9PEZI|nr:hypothetical protein CAC42_6970 [Sphaceloma murrayae]